MIRKIFGKTCDKDLLIEVLKKEMEIFIELIIAIAAGIFCGVGTGLAPGIHVNLIVTLLVATAATLLQYAEPITLCTFIVALSVTHIFLEILPSIFLGCPNPETALSVLPGHRYLIAGNGLMAVKLSIIGCFFGILGGVLCMYPLIYLLPKIYNVIKEYMAFLLILIIIAMLLQNKRKIWAAVVFLLAGIAGLLVFALPIKDPLFPLLSGLFGIATLLMSLFEKENIPQQYDTEMINIDKRAVGKAIMAGQFSAAFISLFPGLSPNIGALFGMQFAKNIGDHGYMVLQGCINATGFLMSIITLYTIQKARNGAIVGIEELLGTIGIKEVLLFTAAILITAAIAAMITLKTGKMFCKMVTKINYKLLTGIIIAVIVLLTIILSGWLGLLVLITTTAIGIIPGIVKVTRTQAMGCLLVPTLGYYL